MPLTATLNAPTTQWETGSARTPIPDLAQSIEAISLDCSAQSARAAFRFAEGRLFFMVGQ
jgi:hypothetical protein